MIYYEDVRNSKDKWYSSDYSKLDFVDGYTGAEFGNTLRHVVQPCMSLAFLRNLGKGTGYNRSLHVDS